jgi:hypothetical protein
MRESLTLCIESISVSGRIIALEVISPGLQPVDV